MKKTIKQEDVVSDLKMLDFYFSDIEFHNARVIGNSIATVSYDISNHSNDNGTRNVEVIITIESKECGVFMQVKAVGIFDATQVVDNPERREFMEKIAPLTTMFPLIRTQIMLFTAQPGISQIILPPIDVHKLIEQSDKIKSE